MRPSILESDHARSPPVKARLARHPRRDVCLTPTSSSWSSLVERGIAPPGGRHIKRGSHRSTRESARAIRHSLHICNEEPAPFAWARTGEEILASPARFRRHVRGSGH